jgi:hypothetical protein
MPQEPHQANRIQSPRVPLNRLRDLVGTHIEHLVETELEFPEQTATIDNLIHQFERHLTTLVATVETYITLQQTITSEFGALIPTAEAHVVHPTFPLPPVPFDLEVIPTSTPTRIGRFPFYAVRKGRTTGLFNNWAECFQSTNGVPNEFRGFQFRHDAQQYLLLPG